MRSWETSPWKPEHACYHGDPFKPAGPLHLDAGRTVNMPGQLMWQSDFSCWSESFIDIWTISRYCHYFKMLGRMPFERLPLFSSFLSFFFACFLIFLPFYGHFIGEGFPAVQFKTSGIGPMSRKLLNPHLQCWEALLCQGVHLEPMQTRLGLQAFEFPPLPLNLFIKNPPNSSTLPSQPVSRIIS